MTSTKLSNISGKEILSQLSRWFSGAKDREGGKKERLYKNKVLKSQMLINIKYYFI
jgi:hypothetical protein